MILNLSTGEQMIGEDHCPDTSIWFRIKSIEKDIRYWKKVERGALGECVTTYDRACSTIKKLEAEIKELESSK